MPGSPHSPAQRILALAPVVTVVACVQFSVSAICGDFDGYYHIKWSRLLWENLRHGHLPAFTWLPLTTLNPARYADQHFLYHLLLIPFTWFGDLRLGAKLGTSLFATLAIYSLYWLVLRYRLRYPWLWLLALLSCSSLFLVRMNLTRASSLSIIFIVAGIYLLFEKKFVWLAPAAFLYVWTYNLFVMLIVLAAIWALTTLLLERRLELRPFLWTCLGTVAGFIVHPYFPRNARLFFEHIASKSGVANAGGITGLEWYSMTSWQFLTGASVAALAMVIGYVAYGRLLAPRHHPDLQRPLLFLLFSTFLMLISLRFARFMEYWPPFAILFAAFTLDVVWNSQELPSDASPDPTGGEGNATGSSPAVSKSAVSTPTLGFAALFLVGALFYNLYAARTSLRAATNDADHYRDAMQWAVANIPPNALIYDVNWSDFPKLFFYDTTHRYVSGLDPIYLADSHPELAQLTDRLSNHAEPDPAEAIAKLFNAAIPGGVNYLFVGDYPAAPPREWFAYMMRSNSFAVVYHDPHAVILELLSQQNATATDNVRHLDNPAQRQGLLAQVQRRFGRDVYATDEENYPGGPALIIHNPKADATWANRLFQYDSNSISGEVLWQVGYQLYIVTNGKDKWVTDVKGTAKFRGAFSSAVPTPSPR
jgi:hypothetical protein